MTRRVLGIALAALVVAAPVSGNSGAPTGTGETPRIPTLEAQVRALEARGDRQAAAALQERIVALHLDGDDPRSIHTVRALHRLAILRQQIGPFEEAETGYRQALTLRESLGGDEHPAVATLLRSLQAMVAKLRPEDEERERLLRRLVEHEPTASHHRQLAGYLAARGAHEPALAQYADALSIAERDEPHDREQLAGFFAAIGQQHLELGALDEAEWYLRRALVLKEDALGPLHPRLASDLKGLGRLYFDQQRFGEAERYWQRALELELAAWGENLHCGCDLRARLVEVRRALGYGDHAPPIEAVGRPLAAAADVVRDGDGPAPSARIEQLDRQVGELRARGLFDDAVELAREALELRRAVHGAASNEVVDGLLALGNLLRSGSRHDEAVAVLGETLELLEGTAPPTAPRRLAALSALGWSYRALGQHDAAMRWHALELEGRELLGQNLRATALLEMLALMSRKSGDTAAARAYLERAEDVWVDMAGPAAPEILRVRAGIAATYTDEGRFEDAEALLLGLLAEAEARRLDPWVVQQVLIPLRDLHRNTGQRKKHQAIQLTD